MLKIFVISDPHFGDKFIIRCENRPFKSVEEMDNAIISNWNSVVGVDDTVFVLGDVSSYSKEKTKKIIEKLNGVKILILGNHDRDKPCGFWEDVGFQSVYKFPICVDSFYWFSHEPMYLNDAMPYVNVHGDIHSKTIHSGGTKNLYFNVSVEKINYTPIDFDEIKKSYR